MLQVDSERSAAVLIQLVIQLAILETTVKVAHEAVCQTKEETIPPGLGLLVGTRICIRWLRKR